MASLVNYPENQRFFDSKKEGNFNKDFLVDNSNMNKDVESHMSAMVQQGQGMSKKKKPKETYQFDTKNESFKRMYNDLYKMGIKNNKFFLRLYDKDLLGIDPYQPILPLELQIKIIFECIINPWYYLREVCRIPEDGSPIEIGGGVQYQIDRNNLAAWYLFLNGIDHYQSKPRQTGKTQDAIAKLVYAYHFGTLSSTMLLFNKDQNQAKMNLYRFKSQRDMIPAYMQMKSVIDENGKADNGINNLLTMRNPVTQNSIMCMPKATSEDSGVKMGRGATSSLQYFDETDYTPWIDKILKASVFAYQRASKNAKKNHSVYGRILTSTPGDIDTRDGADMTKMITRMLPWKDEYYDEPMTKLKSILASPGYNGLVFIEHTWQQLGLTMEWYEEQCKGVDYDEEVILRDVLLQRLSGSNKSPFKRADLLYITRNKREPIESIDYSKNLSYIHIYEEINPKIHYILAIDTAEGLGQDNNAFVLINPHTQMPVAEFKSPYIAQPDYFKLLCKFIGERCPKCMIVIESNRGRELINYFLRSKYKYQLWYDKDKLSNKIVQTYDEYGALKQAASDRRAWGFATTRSSRPDLFMILETFMEERKDCLRTQYMVEDINGLIREHGSIKHADGKHDDIVMSYLIGLLVYFNATNLEEFGIIRGATEPILIDENDPRAIKEKYKSFMDILPDNLKQLFGEVLKEKSPAESEWDYAKGIQQQINAQKPYQNIYGMNNTDEDDEESYYNPNHDDILFEQENGSLWSNLDNDIFESNFDHSRSDVDIDDFI